MARLSTRSAKSAQKSTIRYIASSNIERTARDFGVSEKTLRSFINAKPETLAQSRSKSYRKILATDTRQVAKENQVRLVPRLTRERYLQERENVSPSQRTVRSMRYTEATVERIRSVDKETGAVRYKPANPERVAQARNQIVNDMAVWNQRSIVEAYQNGVITKKEARTLMRKLYKNSGVSAARADAAFGKLTGE